MNDSSSGANQQLSKFDSTIAVLIRIDELLKDAHRHSRKGDMLNWNFDLDRFYTELSDDATPEDYKKFNDFNNQISKSGGNKARLYNILFEKELFIRKLQKKQGKGIGYKNEDDEGM